MGPDVGKCGEIRVEVSFLLWIVPEHDWHIGKGLFADKLPTFTIWEWVSPRTEDIHVHAECFHRILTRIRWQDLGAIDEVATQLSTPLRRKSDI
jgi:hypothetical protein